MPGGLRSFSRLREYGTPTKAMLQAVLAPLPDYADSTELTILAPSRTGSRNATNVGACHNASMSFVAWDLGFWVAGGGGGVQVFPC